MCRLKCKVEKVKQTLSGQLSTQLKLSFSRVAMTFLRHSPGPSLRSLTWIFSARPWSPSNRFSRMPMQRRRISMRYASWYLGLGSVNVKLSLLVIPPVSPRFGSFWRSTLTAGSLPRVSILMWLLPRVLLFRVVSFPESRALRMWSSLMSAPLPSLLRPLVVADPLQLVFECPVV